MNKYQQLFRLDGKVVVVTGAAGILGSEFCKALYGCGAAVACLDVDANNLKKCEIEIAKKCDINQFIFIQCDVSNFESVKQSVEKIIQHFSRIDILLNNAATKTDNLKDFFTKFEDYSLNTWKEIMSVNLDGMFLMAQAVGRQMKAQKNGVIIQTASIYSLLGPDQRIYQDSYYLGGEINTPAVYTASKAGVIGLTKHLAALWGSYNIRVNAICPGGVDSGQNEEFKKRYVHRIPLGRMAEKNDIVGPLLFLVSDAAKYMTGQVLFADGGLSAW